MSENIGVKQIYFKHLFIQKDRKNKIIGVNSNSTYGKYIKLAEELKDKDAISQGKYEEILLNGFRSDIVYGSNPDEEEVYD